MRAASSRQLPFRFRGDLRHVPVAWAMTACSSIALAMGSATPLAAQASDDSGPGVNELREARRAQASFERTRRFALPRTWGEAGRCDVRIGRYCYWYDEKASEGPPEPVRVAVERRRLLQRLDSAASARPEDDWIAGQRVRYWIEAGHADTALLAARECRGTAWWCTSLAAYALHMGDDRIAADSAVSAALAAMPADERCTVGDLSHLLDGGDQSRYRSLPCDARVELEERFWWLATPFFSTGGNERRAEHLARVTLSRIADDSRNPYGVTWGRDLHELLVRYGWPERWSQRDRSLTSAQDGGIVGHEPSPAYHFTPPLQLVDDPFSARAADWPLRHPMAHERYAPHPLRGRHLHELAASAAVLQRGDSVLLFVDYRLPDDDSLPRFARDIALAASPRPGEVHVARAALRTPAGADTIRLPRAAYLLSLEALGDSGHAARARLGVSASARPSAVSDLVLLRSDADTPPSLATALAQPLGGDEISAPGRVALYWEIYGLSAGVHRLRTTLVVEGERAGWVTRGLDWLRRAPGRTPVRLQWTDIVTADEEKAATGVHVDLPPLPRGRYMLELRVRGDGISAASSREIVITR